MHVCVCACDRFERSVLGAVGTLTLTNNNPLVSFSNCSAFTAQSRGLNVAAAVEGGRVPALGVSTVNLTLSCGSRLGAFDCGPLCCGRTRSCVCVCVCMYVCMYVCMCV
jgi:hypothetical protein